MTFQDAFNEIKGIFSHANVQDYRGHLAIQVTMTGEGVAIEPYDYNDHDVWFISDTNDFLQIARGEMNVVAAYTVGKVRVEGDLGKASEIQRLVGWTRH